MGIATPAGGETKHGWIQENNDNDNYNFNGDPDTIRGVMDEDPGVKAGIFVYELHPCRSFPGDSLPA